MGGRPYFLRAQVPAVTVSSEGKSAETLTRF